MNDIRRLLASLDGTQIPGGCERCDAYQTMRVGINGVHHVTVHHDDWCPWLNDTDHQD